MESNCEASSSLFEPPGVTSSLFIGFSSPPPSEGVIASPYNQI
jgi:hypothetical protein